jgi:hypothetical protein
VQKKAKDKEREKAQRASLNKMKSRYVADHSP